MIKFFKIINDFMFCFFLISILTFHLVGEA